MSMPAQGPRGGQPQVEPRGELANALRACRGAIAGIALASALINVLYLTGSIYMLEVYDRVLPSRSIPTLIGLSVLVLGLYGFQGLLDLLRGRILVRIGRSLGAEPERAGSISAIARLALQHARQRRRIAAASRSRSGPRLSVEPRPAGTSRSAVDAVLHRHLLHVPLLAGSCGAGRRHRSRQSHHSDRDVHAGAARKPRTELAATTQRAGRGVAPQRRSAHAMGMAPHRGAMGAR